MQTQSSHQDQHVRHVKALLEKRITTWVYLKQSYEEKVFFFNSVLVQKAELNEYFSPAKMRARSSKYMSFGMNLATTLNIASPSDFLRGLLVCSIDFDDDKPTSKNPFRSGKSRRNVSAAEVDVPFDLDYLQVLYSLSETMLEVYTKMLLSLTTDGASDIISKIDSRLKKISLAIARDIESLARSSIRNEMAALTL